MHWLTPLCSLVLLQVATCITATTASAASPVLGPAKPQHIWVSAYYAAWRQDYLPPQAIDLRAVTQIIHFAIVPNADGTLQTDANGMTAAKSQAIVTAAHAAGKKGLIAVGGADSGGGFKGALSEQYRATFITNLLDFIVARGYDGLDIDMEPMDDANPKPYQTFIHELRQAMRARNPAYLLTAAVGGNPATFVPLQDDFDEINIMTYDLSGNWGGWESWYNAALYTDGHKFKSTGGLMPSCDSLAAQWTNAGIQRHKLGIGLDFYGYVWPNASGPNQALGTQVPYSLSYADIMSKYYWPDRYHWHQGVAAPYLSIAKSGNNPALFISYDDERLCAEKIKYAQSTGLGGVIIWELAGGYRADLPDGKRDALLQAIYHAFQSPTKP